jgi:hypothetical protein
LVHRNVFREFFRATNRVGGIGRDGYRFRISELTGLERNIVEKLTVRLLDEGLVQEEHLTDVLYSPTEAVVAIINRSPKLVLSLLYTEAEIESPAVEVFCGSTYYKDGRPDYFTDMDEKPLEGPFKLDERTDEVTFFREGRIVPKL